MSESAPVYNDMLSMSAEQLTKIALDHPKFAVRQKAITAIYHAGLREGVAIANAAHDRVDERVAAARANAVKGFAHTPLTGLNVVRLPVGVVS